MDNNEELIDFFQDFSSHHETMYNFPPLTSKIYTYIMCNNFREGVTFDEIVEKLNASKSSVSNSLNLLINNNQIEHFSKIDERRRFFRLNPEYLSIRLNVIRDTLEKEKSLTLRMQELKTKNGLELIKCTKRMHIYIEHLENATHSLTETIEKLKNSN